MTSGLTGFNSFYNGVYQYLSYFDTFFNFFLHFLEFPLHYEFWIIFDFREKIEKTCQKMTSHIFYRCYLYFLHSKTLSKNDKSFVKKWQVCILRLIQLIKKYQYI